MTELNFYRFLMFCILIAGCAFGIKKYGDFRVEQFVASQMAPVPVEAYPPALAQLQPPTMNQQWPQPQSHLQSQPQPHKHSQSHLQSQSHSQSQPHSFIGLRERGTATDQVNLQHHSPVPIFQLPYAQLSAGPNNGARNHDLPPVVQKSNVAGHTMQNANPGGLPAGVNSAALPRSTATIHAGTQAPGHQARLNPWLNHSDSKPTATNDSWQPPAGPTGLVEPVAQKVTPEIDPRVAEIMQIQKRLGGSQIAPIVGEINQLPLVRSSSDGENAMPQQSFRDSIQQLSDQVNNDGGMSNQVSDQISDLTTGQQIASEAARSDLKIPEKKADQKSDPAAELTIAELTELLEHLTSSEDGVSTVPFVKMERSRARQRLRERLVQRLRSIQRN